MPECDGFSLIDKMHALRYTMRIIVITGRPQSDSLAQALSKGALGLLQKPFSEASLLELLNKV